ncbi:hypothetical protein [Bradyrhizobium sp. USDA 4449]
MKSTEIACGNQLICPANLTPEDFDWERSGSVKPWRVRDRHHHGPWHLERFELSKADVTAILLPGVGSTALPAKKHRRRPQREAAEIAIKALWPDGVPPQHDLPNDRLVDLIIKWLKDQRLPISQQDTILRAAGRRK